MRPLRQSENYNHRFRREGLRLSQFGSRYKTNVGKNMDIRTVSREKLPSRKTDKYQALFYAIGLLEPGGKAVQVTYRDRSHLNAIRNAVYAHNSHEGTNIKSSAEDGVVYFYIPETKEAVYE